MRSDWKRNERGDYEHVSDRARIFRLRRASWRLWVLNELPGGLDFRSLRAAMDYADKHYPMEQK